MSNWKKQVSDAFKNDLSSPQRGLISLSDEVIDKLIDDFIPHAQNGRSSRQHELNQYTRTRTKLKNAMVDQSELIDIYRDIEARENRIHLQEQLRLLIFRTATAFMIGISIVLAGLVANELGVVLSIPLIRPF